MRHPRLAVSFAVAAAPVVLSVLTRLRLLALRFPFAALRGAFAALPARFAYGFITVCFHCRRPAFRVRGPLAFIPKSFHRPIRRASFLAAFPARLAHRFITVRFHCRRPRSFTARWRHFFIPKFLHPLRRGVAALCSTFIPPRMAARKRFPHAR